MTQPNFVAERGDQYLADVPAAEHHELWRVASLLKAGVKVALSTDMPFGEGDPWATMRAAVHRTTAVGAVLGPDECVSAREALTMFFGTSGQPTEPAHHRSRANPATCACWPRRPTRCSTNSTPQMVAATVVAGEVGFRARLRVLPVANPGIAAAMKALMRSWPKNVRPTTRKRWTRTRPW